ncbi:unnamed protein product [Enterobius vermicularis]|uniref:Ribonuclease H2 subunit C n=1 Tax=Enterobius vermicularis TaxID=51028 RepID=A0A0N4V955_ENTVE|nr:unnamed protein product [Enterobius vermicularis]
MFKPVVVILNGKKAADEAGPELHSIPCKIQHTGQANVSSYFLREKHDGGNEKSTFRGRFLDGCFMKVPPHYKLYTLRERSNKTDHSSYDVERSIDGFTLWEYDKLPSTSSPLPRAINVLKISEDLAGDD